MMTPPVCAARTRDWAPVARTLAAAFAHDPVFGWLLPDEGRRELALGRLFALEGRRMVLPHRRSVLVPGAAEPLGAALVLPPDAWRTPLWALTVFAPQYLAVFGRRLPKAFTVISALEKLHLRQPHVYFPYIGVLRSVQGRGIGQAMISSILRVCDRDGLPAYLEASNPRCVGLYDRLGFVGTQEVTPGGCPPILLMRRDPVGPPDRHVRN